MIDEYGNSGHGRYNVRLSKGNGREYINLEICADTAPEASDVAVSVASDERHIIWEDEAAPIRVDRVDQIDYQDDEAEDSENQEENPYYE